MPGVKNTRRHERFPCYRPVRLIVGRDTVLNAHAMDISESGLGAIVAHHVEIGQPVTVEIAEALGSGSLVLNGVVRRRTGVMHGMELVNLSHVQAGILRQLCARG